MILVTNNEGRPGVGHTAELLREGLHGLDAMEAGIRIVESDETIRTVGRGGWPNLIGEMQLDASVMDGNTLRTGAVGAIQGFLHPVSIARQVMERIPHELLVGDGAERFAREIGAEAGDNLIEDSKRVWQEWFDSIPERLKENWTEAPLIDLCKELMDFVKESIHVRIWLVSSRNLWISFGLYWFSLVFQSMFNVFFTSQQTLVSTIALFPNDI